MNVKRSQLVTKGYLPIIHLKSVDKDKYYRLLAKIEYDGVDLSEAVSKAGYAHAYFGDAKPVRDWCKELEAVKTK